MRDRKQKKIHGADEEGQIRSENSLLPLGHFILFLILFIGPQLFLKDCYDFANLPQQAFIHVVSTLFFAYVIFSFHDHEGFRVYWTNYYIPVLGFMLWASMSISYAHNKYEAFSVLLMWLGPLTVFLGLVNARLSKTEIIRILNFIFASAVLSAIIGSLQYLLKFPFIPQVVEPAATFANKNMAAHIMVLSIPLGITLFLTAQSKFLSFCYAMGTSLLLVFLYYTKTKAAWLAFLVQALLLFGYLLFVRPKVWWSKAKQVFLLVKIITVGILINLSAYGWSPAFKEISQRANLVKEAVVGNEQAAEQAYLSVGLRIAIYKNTLEMIKDRPLLGFGLGNHKVYYPIYHRRAVEEKVFSEESQLYNVHNDLLQIFSETGLVGVSFLILLGFFWARSAKRLAIDRKGDETGLLAAGIFLGILGIFVNSNFCFPSFRAVPPLIVMTFTALLFSLERISNGKGQIYIKIKRPINFIMGSIFIILACYLAYYYNKLITSDKYYLIISRCEDRNDWKCILEIAPKELALEPDRARIRSYLGRAYIEIGKCKEGIDELSKVLQYYPYHMNALLNLGVGYSCIGEHKKALETYQKVLDIKPDYAKAYSNMGYLQMKLGNMKEAMDLMKEAVRLNPKDPAVLTSLGILYLKSGEVEDAINVLERSIILNPKQALTYRHLGLAYLKVGQTNQAIEAMEKSIKLAPNQPDSKELEELVRKLKEKGRGG